MASNEIRLHHLLAQGKEADLGEGTINHPFKGVALHGGEELSKKPHLKDHKRGMKHLGRVAEHGEHGMYTSMDGDSDCHKSR